MKKNYIRWLGFVYIIVFALCMNACGINDTPVPVPDYPSKIIGSWEGTIHDLKETMLLKNDGTFICHVIPKGFLANTLSQPLTGTIRGKWQINGKNISMQVSSEKHEHIENNMTLSTIVSFKQDSLVLQSVGGGVSAFRRTARL